MHHRFEKAVPHMMVVAQARRRRQKGDSFAAEFVQLVHRRDREGGVVEVVERMVDAHRGAPVGHERHAVIEHVANTRIVRLGAGNDDPVGGAGLHDVAHRLQRVVVAGVGRHDQVIRGGGQELRNAVDDVRNETADLLFRVEHEADDVGLACPQAHAGPVWAVTDLAGHQLHPLARLCADLWSILEGAGHCGHAEPGHIGKRLQRRPSGFAGGVVHAWLVLEASVHAHRLAAISRFHNHCGQCIRGTSERKLL